MVYGPKDSADLSLSYKESMLYLGILSQVYIGKCGRKTAWRRVHQSADNAGLLIL